ncbi:conserved hypothetical protein [Rippkaea orientalis PCC 8801]|uniref:Uncharacterized protein n=1 Tax=Rippkaea orientalis (strain PCC 8801 / RF-1) TaxID=41431 RepID=B7K010_RIPO1|nr:DUF6515 family protein [Rippkaea orientalis]ACK66157.1 conserved hypothetical protein [Rippkaea orientalis PCC 8801]
MKLNSRNRLITFITILLLITVFCLEPVSAQRGRRGGGGGGSRGGGSFRGNGASPRVNRSVNLQNRGNFSRSQSGRSQNRQANLQNRQGTFDQRQQNRQGTFDQRQQNRQGTFDQRQQNRQGTFDQRQQNRQANLEQGRQNRQDNFDQRQQNRQDNFDQRQQNRQTNLDNRQDAINQRQQNRQNFIDDNYYGGRWVGGGWYGGGYYVPPGWGAWAATVGLATGLAIGASVSSPPPYYNTVYVGDSSYLYSDGVYMQPTGDAYTIVAPPTGVVVSYLPEGCTQTQVNNNLYYVCSDIYYQPFYQNGTTVYKVVNF